MKFHEEFDIKQPPAQVWAFFERVDEVAGCLPGVESVQVHDEDNLEVKVTQSVGPMSATFSAKVKIIDREPGRRIAFTAVGKTVRGASGNIRATNEVVLAELDGVGTRVTVDSDVALAGVLGSVGQKVIAKQASKVVAQLAGNLQQALSGEAHAPAVAPKPAWALASVTAAPAVVTASQSLPDGALGKVGQSLRRPPSRWEFLVAAAGVAVVALVRRRR